MTLKEIYKRLLFVGCVIIALNGCAVQRHSATDTVQNTSDFRQQTSLQTKVLLDSVLQTLSMNADSVIIIVTPSASVEASDMQPSNLSEQASLALKGSPSIRITAHNPQIKADKQSRNLVVTQIERQDSATTQNIINSHANNSKEVVGVARPMNGTAVVIVISLAIILAACIFLYLVLKKYRII